MIWKWIDADELRWCWLRLGGAALMLQEFRREGHDSWAPKGIVGEGVSIYFICEDALAIYREVTSSGIKASRPFVGNGMWVTPLLDPMVTKSTSRATRTHQRRRCTPNRKCEFQEKTLAFPTPF
jgi:hypothetical protein